MTIGTDKVQVVKRESAALGGNASDDVDYYQPIAPQTDAIESAGVYLQDGSNRDELVYIARNGSNLVLRDITANAEIPLKAMYTMQFRHHFLLMGG